MSCYAALLLMAECSTLHDQQMHFLLCLHQHIALHNLHASASGFCLAQPGNKREASEDFNHWGHTSTMCGCLQIQMRDIPGYVETRQQLLQLKSNAKGHWLGFAVAHHLNGNHALAVQILEAFEQTQEGVPDNEQYEQSEMVMYKAMILREGGDLEQALDLLQTHKVTVCDLPDRNKATIVRRRYE